MGLAEDIINRSALRPFVVGLVGHRELSPTQLSSLQEQFDAFLLQLLESFRETPILVLTSIAEGADRLAHSSKYRNRIQICSVLPMPLNEYAKDFYSKKQRKTFEALVEDSEYVITFNEKSYKAFVGAARNKAYKDCADWISDHSNSLVAIWDGGLARGLGGTAGTVRRRLRTMGANSHFDQGGITFRHILASNAGSASATDCECDGHSEITATDVKNLTYYEKLNSFLTTSKVQLKPESLDSHFELFDTEAIHLQKVFVKRTKFLLGLGVLTVNLASIQLALLNIFTLLPTLLLLLVTVFFWSSLTKSQIKNAYETFRLLAEVLRVQIWWNSCGISKSTLNEITELRETDSVVRLLLANTALMVDISSHGGNPKLIGNDDPRIWIQEQKHYLVSSTGSGAITRSEMKGSMLRNRIYASVLIAGASLIVGSFWSSLAKSNLHDTIEWVTSSIFTFSLSAAAAVAAFSQVMSYNEIVGRYRIKEYRLQKALDTIRGTKSRAGKQKIARAVGIDSLSEAFRWFQTKSDRQVRPFQ